MRMLRRYCILLLAFFLTACPMFGLAAQDAPACTHCPAAGAMAIKHCHQHTASAEHCHQCAGCAACAFMPMTCIQTGSPSIALPHPDIARVGYHAAHFYRLSSPPLDRPPASFPA